MTHKYKSHTIYAIFNNNDIQRNIQYTVNWRICVPRPIVNTPLSLRGSLNIESSCLRRSAWRSPYPSAHPRTFCGDVCSDRCHLCHLPLPPQALAEGAECVLEGLLELEGHDLVQDRVDGGAEIVGDPRYVSDHGVRHVEQRSWSGWYIVGHQTLGVER